MAWLAGAANCREISEQETGKESSSIFGTTAILSLKGQTNFLSFTMSTKCKASQFLVASLEFFVENIIFSGA